MNPRLGFLRDKANKLSRTPGVYLMKDKTGKIIYVGKAKALKNRVTTYFHSLESHNTKTLKLVDNIYDFDFIVTTSELDALVLECSLIKQYNPKYNILLKDDKGYNYIKITREDFPRISYALNCKDENADYLGPYTGGYTAKQAVEEANRIFMLPSCHKNFPRDFKKERPCLNYHIKRCMGVCRGKISKDEYTAIIQSAMDYMRNGSKVSVEQMTEEMNRAAENLEFEKAARLRDRIRSIEKMKDGQGIISDKEYDFDVIGLAQNAELASIAVIKYRGGRITDKENFYIGDEYEAGQMRSDFCVGYYSERADEIPKQIYIDTEMDDSELLCEYFSALCGHKVTISVPKRGEGLSRVMLAKSNASEYLALKVGRTVKEINALEDLAKLLGLKKIPTIIESYDISNIGEDARVGGMVVYRNGRPYKAGYRKFAIKYVQGQNDYACMQEVLERRLRRYLDGDESFKPLPDLILLDGGKGHVSAVQQVLGELQLDIPLFGLVKDDKHRTRAIAAEGGEIEIKSNKKLFSLLTGIQDEVHRFSITFQRQKHKQKTYELELTKIRGIGEAKALALIKQFKTKQGLKEAGVEELASAAKISAEKAQEVYEYIQENF
ncbi:MAG: excinuclease ABC subunit UvrC [Eubacterium sp.]|nr:excinuclease ABC subunit UvrC [Eubacterium sp.]